MPADTSPAPGSTAPRSHDQSSSIGPVKPLAPASAEQVGSAVVKSDKSVAITFTDDDGLSGRFIRELVACGTWAKLEGGDKAVIGAMCAFVRTTDVTDRGEPIVAPSLRDIQKLAGIGEVTARRRTHALEGRGVITAFSRGVGQKRSVYILHFAAQNVRSSGVSGDATLAAIKAAKSSPQNERDLFEPLPSDAPAQSCDGGERDHFRPLCGALSDGSQMTVPSETIPQRDHFEPLCGALSDGSQSAPPPENGSDTLSCLSVVVVDLNTTATAGGGDRGAEGAIPLGFSQERRTAADLLTSRGVTAKVAISILTDPTVQIADEFLCAVIRKNTPAKRPRKPGAWYRIMLREYLDWGPDEVKERIASHQARGAELAGDCEAIGQPRVAKMTDAQIEEARNVLVDRFDRQGKVTERDSLKKAADLRSKPAFWRLVGRRIELFPFGPAASFQPEGQK